MKTAVVQPFYSTDPEKLDSCFNDFISLCDTCDPSLDLIVFPEYCDVPASTSGAGMFADSVKKYNALVRKKISETARRCKAIVFANFADITPSGMRNTTFAFDREGNEVGKYYKAHPAPSEVKRAEEGGNALDCSYSYSYAEPYIIEIEGIRFAFLTCYDFYMYENFPQIARYKPDVIIGCSHQRTDLHRTLSVIGSFLSYNTDAWLVRAAVSMGNDSPVCGCSMICAPDGEIVLNMKNDVGIGVTDIDPHRHFKKSAGYKGKPASHPDYIEEGRRPWLYRPAGSMTVLPEKLMPYPRVCAHRGFSTVAPENSLPAFGAAVALGAEEIEFDIWSTSDGELVSIHDSSLDRVSNGTGKVYDHTFEELLSLDFGSVVGERFAGLKIVTFEEILKKFARTVVMNIHVKIWDKPGLDHQYERIASLIRKYDCASHAYMMSSNDQSLADFMKIAPDIPVCVGWDGSHDVLSMPERAIALGAKKIQLFKPYFDQSTVDLAKKNGILCNVFWSDDPEEACGFLDMGIDTILSNDYLLVKNAVDKYKAEKIK
ncbi:MAG: hypothetical protein IJV00_01340 [Clostridia bacterium]|nr:hypothetical protein [Clostridia bacterium]